MPWPFRREIGDIPTTCNDVDFGGNLAKDHLGSQRHVCALEADHVTDHRCVCGWSWKKWRKKR